MNFELSKEQKLIQKNIREFMLKEVEPIAEKIDREDYFPREVWDKLGELGYMALSVDPKYGGSGYDMFTHGLVMEQMSRVNAAVSLSYGAHTLLCAHNIENNANEDLKQKYLPDLASGKKIGCMGLTEPDAGSDAISISTSAVKDGKNYILNGSKMFITNGPVADIALVYTKTEPELGARGITAFIVETDFPGFSISKHIDKMGHRGSPTGELVFSDCIVPEENIVGKVNEGVKVMMRGLDVERAILSVSCLGLAENALELALDYAKKRKQFGQPIAKFQLIQAKLADMYTEIEAARGLTYRAAILTDSTDKGGRGTEIHKLAGAAILFAAEVANRAVNHAVQIHGGYGYTLEYTINRLFRDAKVLEIGAGTSEVRRILIAEDLIKRGLNYV